MPGLAALGSMGGGGLQSSASSSASSAFEQQNRAAFSTGGINFGQQNEGESSIFNPQTLGIIALAVVAFAIISTRKK